MTNNFPLERIDSLYPKNLWIPSFKNFHLVGSTNPGWLYGDPYPILSSPHTEIHLKPKFQLSINCPQTLSKFHWESNLSYLSKQFSKSSEQQLSHIKVFKSLVEQKLIQIRQWSKQKWLGIIHQEDLGARLLQRRDRSKARKLFDGL